VGFTTGDGSFSASRYRLDSFRAKFCITQHPRDLELLEVIKSYLGVGSVYKNGSVFTYEVGSYKDCLKYVIPFLLFFFIIIKKTGLRSGTKNILFLR
jgi:hypothetical protein